MPVWKRVQSLAQRGPRYWRQRVLNVMLHPVHVIIAISVGLILRIWTRVSGTPIRVIALPTYSFGPLCRWSATEVSIDAENFQTDEQGTTVLFLHLASDSQQPFTLGRILARRHESVHIVSSRLLRWFYSAYRPAHQEEPLFKTWSSNGVPKWATPRTRRQWNYRIRTQQEQAIMRETFSLDVKDSDVCASVLKEQGWEPSRHRGLAALNVRDSKFRMLQNKMFDSEEGINPRDGFIEDYSEAALYLANQGFFVIRMGVCAREKLPVVHPNIWDYATHESHFEELDFYIASQATLVVSNSSGWDLIPPAFGIPVALVDVGAQFFWAAGEEPEQGWPLVMCPRPIYSRIQNRPIEVSELASDALGSGSIWNDLTSRRNAYYEMGRLATDQIRDSVIVYTKCVEDPIYAESLRAAQQDIFDESWMQWKSLMPAKPATWPIIPPKYLEENSHWLLA